MTTRKPATAQALCDRRRRKRAAFDLLHRRPALLALPASVQQAEARARGKEVVTDLKAIKKLLDEGRVDVNQGHLKDAPYWLDAIEELLSMIAPRPIETAPRALIARRMIDARSPVADALLDFRDPPRSPRSCRLAALEQELAAAMVRAEKAERERDVLALNQGRPWALPDVLRRLADAADHLLHDHNCDNHGHEAIALARNEARQMLAGLEEAKGP